MSLENRLSKLETAQQAEDQKEWNLVLSRLTEAELISLHGVYSEAVAAGKPAANYMTPDLEAALERASHEH